MAREDAIRRQRERATHLVTLKESPSYPVLKEIIETKIRQEMRKFLETPAVSQQELDYFRGRFSGMRIVLDVIEKGEQQLELAIRAAQALEEAEGVS